MRDASWIKLTLGAQVVMLALAFYALAAGQETTAFVLAAAPLGLVLALRIPYLASILFVTTSFFRIHETIPVLAQLQLPLLLSELGIVGFGLWLVFERPLDLHFPPQLRAFLVFSALVSAGVLWSQLAESSHASSYNFKIGVYVDPDPQVPFNVWSESFVKVIIMTTICALIGRTQRDLVLATVSFIMSGVLLAILTMANKVRGIGLLEGTRAVAMPGSESLLGDPNDTALLILCPLALAIAFAASPGRASIRLIALGAATIQLGGIIATQSRGAVLGTAAVMAVLGLRTIKSKVVLLTIVGLGVVALATLMGLQSRTSGGAEFAQAALDESSANRLIAWRSAWSMAMSHPLFGVGLGEFTPSFYAHADAWVDHAMAVHSSWFQVMAETGFLGLAVFVVMVIGIGLSLYKSERRLKVVTSTPTLRSIALGLLAAFCGWLLSASFITHGFTWPIYSLLALSVILEKSAGAPEIAVETLPFGGSPSQSRLVPV